MAPRAQTLRPAQHRGSPYDRELSSYHMEILSVAIVGYVFEECHAHCMLKTSFVDLGKGVGTL
jgi:hypothetical protein